MIKDYIVDSIDPETEEVTSTNYTNREFIKLGGDGTGYPFVFSSITGLKAIEISHKVSDYAFRGAIRLENVLIHICDSAHTYKACDELRDQMFENCYALNKCVFDGNIVFNNNFSWSGNDHFAYATGLKEIILPNGLNFMPSMSFKYNYNLKSIVFPETMVDLSNDFMTQCQNMTSLTIPKNVTAFNLQTGNNKNLTTLIMKPISPPTMTANIGDRNNSGFTIIVPRGSLEAYQTANYWSNCASKMVEADE